MSEVILAAPPHSMDRSSTGNARNMLIKQYRFPHIFDKDRDKHIFQDHDRLLDFDYSHFREVTKRHTGSGELSLGSWVERQWPKTVLAYLIEVLKADPAVKWTGWRVMVTVHGNNGSPVFHLELFAKHRETKTKVYTRDNAPNVRGYKEGRLPRSSYDNCDIMGRPIKRYFGDWRDHD